MAAARAEHAAFDASRLADFTERIHFNAPAFSLSPLVREAGRLVSTAAAPSSCRNLPAQTVRALRAFVTGC